ncbi:MAG: lipoprotein [Bradyrhizobium sp.]|uniref:LPS translocon maturation chaperone LptM n=1 Tax=Bradyrhizobium sp. TaxID=376 RepID=UPI001E041637|nr:lipoprotein [Bradyrhizobium sp.]MBV9560216.1 lipoprotein [Bradyrhizobium sp.]
MNRNFRPTASGWAIILLSAASLVLGACGRKGPLDLPPTASAPTASAAPATTETQSDAASKGTTLFGSNYTADAPPQAARGQKKSFLLDPLLGPGPHD